MDDKITCLQDAACIQDQVVNRVGRRTVFTEFYRGQGSDDFKLLPKLFRTPRPLPDHIATEKSKFDDFVRHVNEHKINVQETFDPFKYPNQQTWFYLFQAQHIGWETRLLDWTKKIKIALLFAVEDENYFNVDGQLWVFYCYIEHFIHNEQDSDILRFSPFTTYSLRMINFPGFMEPNAEKYVGEQRRARQHGQFLIQPIKDAIEPLENQPGVKSFLTKYLIDKNAKKRIKDELAADGITLDWILCR